MLITKDWLKSLDPCTDGFRWWCRKYGEQVTLSEFVKACDEEWCYVRWLAVRCLTHRSQVQFAIWCAEKVIHLYTGQSDAPAKAIEAAKNWIANPTAANAYAAAYAAYAADTAAYAASNAAYAASNAAYAAYHAAYAADTAAYASYAANTADDAAKADESFRHQAMDYLLALETIDAERQEVER